MAKRRPSGDGMVRKREDGRWEGRIVIGHKENGDPIFHYIYANTQKELTAKLRQNITAYQGVDLTEECKMTLSEWLEIGSTLALENFILGFRLGTRLILEGLDEDDGSLVELLRRDEWRGKQSNYPSSRPRKSCYANQR